VFLAILCLIAAGVLANNRTSSLRQKNPSVSDGTRSGARISSNKNTTWNLFMMTLSSTMTVLTSTDTPDIAP
jgi:hypothetical protein